MARVPLTKRRRIQLEYARSGNVSATARKFHVSHRTVRRWASRILDTSGVGDKPGRGRKPAISRALAHAAYKMLTSNRYNGAMHVARELHKRNPSSAKNPICKNTLIKHAKSYAESISDKLVCDRRQPAEQLTEKCMSARVEFCKANMKRNWHNVMFTDRKRFYFLYPGSSVKASVWHSVGERQVAYRPSAPQCLNLYCGITRFGATACCCVSGTSCKKKKFKTSRNTVARNICSKEYYFVVKNHFLKKGDLLFHAHGIRFWVLQQDNDRCHAGASSTALTDYLSQNKKSKIQILPGWPAHSPDLSPIENFWSVVQMKANKMGCKTFAAFKRAVLCIIKHADKKWFTNYFNSMRARLLECIQNKGARIKH
jgi:hypothetical protein